MKTRSLRAVLVGALALAPLSLASAQTADEGTPGYLAPADDGYVAPDRSATSPGGPEYLQRTPDGYIPGTGSSDGYLPSGGSGGDGYLGAAQPKGAVAANDGFVAAPAGSTEQINGGRLMLIAYAGFWLLSLAYIASLAQRARVANKEVRDLRQQLLELDDRLEELEAGRS